MYQGKKIIQIVARGLNGEIGANNKLLWNIPEDLQFFKESTIGHVVLMGRKTYENLPKKLSRRIVMSVSSAKGRIPITDYLSWAVTQCCRDLNTNQIFIAGGAKLFNSTFDIIDELWITQVEKEYPEADTYYNTPLNFELYSESEPISCLDRISGECVNIKFQKWRRK